MATAYVPTTSTTANADNSGAPHPPCVWRTVLTYPDGQGRVTAVDHVHVEIDRGCSPR